MPKVTTSITNFSGGEISPRAIGRYDLAKFPNSVKKLENFLNNQLGGAFFKQGQVYIAGAKNNDKRARLVPFQYESGQDYVLEMGDLYARIYNNSRQQITFQNWNDTILMLHCDGTDGSTTITDEIGNYCVAIADAQIDTAQSKFGGASLLLDGTGDYVTVAISQDLEIGYSDFTIDFWVRPNISAGTEYHLISWGHPSTPGELSIWRDTSNRLVGEIDGNANIFGTWNPTNGTWYHIAMVRNGLNTYMFVNGTQLGSTWTHAKINVIPSGNIYIGCRSVYFDYLWNGHFDEIRVCKTAKWTANFTPSTSAYSPDATELTLPYLEADLRALMFAHKNDVKYIAHGSYPLRKIIRTGITAFSTSAVSLIRGPFRDDNITDVTITPSAATGAGITLTASGNIFYSSHVGSLFKVHKGVVKITSFTSATVVIGDVQDEPDGTAGNIDGTSAYKDWAEGAFSDYRGYPRSCVFHDGRLWLGGNTSEPQKIWGSVQFAYENFDAGTADDADAVTFEVSTDERVAIKWLASVAKALKIGTNGGTFSANGANSGTITPDSIQITKDTAYGTLSIAPKQISAFLYYIQRSSSNIREIRYNYDIDAREAIDMNILADHILRDGNEAVEMDVQQSPNDRLWCIGSSGEMIILTRNPQQEIMGWCRLISGRDAFSSGEYESVAIIQKPTGDDEVWVIVKRTIGGSTKRYIEYFTPEYFTDDFDAVRVDSAVTRDTPITITGATKASPVVITALSHGLSNGNQVRIDNINGMTELNKQSFLIANKTGDTFELTNLLGVNIDGTAYSTYKSGGEVRLMSTAVTGLSHLEGETVSVQVDGVADTHTYVVSSGAITLNAKAAVVHVGLPYEGTIQLLPLSDGSATGTGQTKNRRVYELTVRLDRSLGMKIGKVDETVENVYFGVTNDTVLTDLFTGDVIKVIQTWWDKRDEIIIKQDIPSPLNILGLVILSEVNER